MIKLMYCLKKTMLITHELVGKCIIYRNVVCFD